MEASLDNKKFYVPKLEEFHIGFEYEYKYKNQDWEYAKFSNSGMDEIAGDYYEFDPENPNTKCRVKYLDQEDIESLGFEKRLNNQWIGWDDYILDDISGEYGYFLQCTLHAPKMDNFYKIYVHRYLNEDVNTIESSINNGESELVYKGAIKNKSELKKLMVQLGIKIKTEKETNEKYV